MGRKGGWYGESQRHSEARKKGAAAQRTGRSSLNATTTPPAAEPTTTTTKGDGTRFLDRARPRGKSQLPIVESGTLTKTQAKALHQELAGTNLQGALEVGGRLDYGSNKRYAVVRQQDTNKILAVMTGDITPGRKAYEYSGSGAMKGNKPIKARTTTYGKRSSKDFTVTALYRLGGHKAEEGKGAGKVLLGEAARLSQILKGDLRIHNSTNRKYYEGLGADFQGGRTTTPTFIPGKRNRLARSRVQHKK
jgi:hypothetical protein